MARAPSSPATAEGGEEVVPTRDHGGDPTRSAILRTTHAEPAQVEGREGESSSERHGNTTSRSVCYFPRQC